MELDTIIPGQLITDSLQSVPLFVYTYDNENILDIYAYFLDTVRLDVNETGHLADLVFKPLESGSDSIYYDINELVSVLFRIQQRSSGFSTFNG